MCPKDVPKVMKTKYPQTDIVFGVVSSEEHVLPAYIFETGLRVNSEIYIEVMQIIVFPWMRKVARGRP